MTNLAFQAIGDAMSATEARMPNVRPIHGARHISGPLNDVVAGITAKAAAYARRNGDRRLAMIAAAVARLGTPYSSGPDKADRYDGWRFVRECVAEARGVEIERLPDPERKAWGVESLATAEAALIRMRFEPMRIAHAEAGDVLLFRMEDGRHHVAVITDTSRSEWKIAHVQWTRAACESWMGPVWQNALVSAWTLDRDAAALGEAA